MTPAGVSVAGGCASCCIRLACKTSFGNQGRPKSRTRRGGQQPEPARCQGFAGQASATVKQCGSVGVWEWLPSIVASFVASFVDCGWRVCQRRKWAVNGRRASRSHGVGRHGGSGRIQAGLQDCRAFCRSEDESDGSRGRHPPTTTATTTVDAGKSGAESPKPRPRNRSRLYAATGTSRESFPAQSLLRILHKAYLGCMLLEPPHEANCINALLASILRKQSARPAKSLTGRQSEP
mgnify:FL=1